MVILAIKLKRVMVILQFSLRKFFKSLVQHWFGVVMLNHVSAFIIQVNFILPFEIAAAGHMGSLASVLFLPHAVRVLSVWLIGPKAFFALFPSSLFISFLYLRHDYDTFTLLLITLCFIREYQVTLMGAAIAQLCVWIMWVLHVDDIRAACSVGRYNGHT